MKDHSGCVRGFVWSSRAWYAESVKCQNAIHFGMYAREGGTSGEMTMRWHDLGGKSVPRLEVFDDGWSALFLFQNLLEKLAEYDNKTISQEQFVEILKTCGFEDLTEYKNPYGKTTRELIMSDLALAEARVRELRNKFTDLR